MTDNEKCWMCGEPWDTFPIKRCPAHEDYHNSLEEKRANQMPELIRSCTNFEELRDLLSNWFEHNEHATDTEFGE